jgi:hypothetical protein
MSDFTKIQKGLLKRLKASFAGLEQCEEVDLKDSYRLVDKKIKVPLRGIPIQVNLGPDGKSLYLYPEWRLNSAGPIEQDMDYILFDPDIFFSEVSGFVRLQDGDEITLGDNETSCVITAVNPAPASRR